MMKRFVFVLCCTLVATTGIRAAEPEGLPSADDLHKLYDAKEYQPLVQKLTRVLQLKGNAAQAYDRVDMLMLRGEALMQLKQQAPAVEAFDAAAKEATNPQQKGTTYKPDEIAKARATALLVHQARLFSYTPRHVEAGQKPEPIPLSDPARRPDAFKALLADQQADLTPKAKAAAHATSLGPIIQLIRGLGDLRAVEQMATSATKQSDALLVDLAEQAHKLMDAEVDRLAPATDTISKNAHTKTKHTSIQRDSDEGMDDPCRLDVLRKRQAV